MKYLPNLDDPRVINRIKHAYGFTKGCLSTEKPSNWSTRTISKYMGRTNNNLGSWLRQILLIKTSDRYNKDRGECKEYKSNQEGLDYIKSLLFQENKQEFTQWVQQNNINTHLTNTPSVQLLFDHFVVNKFYNKEFPDEFEYQDKSNRLWHPLQNIKREYKQSIFIEKNLRYQYDIDSCAPTLLHQYSQKLNMDLYLFAIRNYLKNKTIIRNELAKELEIEPAIVKVIVNSLFSGARLGYGDQFQLSKLLNHDQSRIEYLKQHEFIQELRSDIKIIWEYIEVTLPKIRDKNNRKVPLSSKRKWQVYFDLERQVLNQVIKYLKLTNNRYFLEHDGWATQSQINEYELQLYVKNNTGFDIKLKMDYLNNINTHLTNTPSVQLLLEQLQ